MNPFLKFLQSARNLQKTQGLSKADILKFAKNEFGDITGLMRSQIDQIFKPGKQAITKQTDNIVSIKKDDIPKKAEGGIMRTGLKDGTPKYRPGDFKLDDYASYMMNKKMFYIPGDEELGTFDIDEVADMLEYGGYKKKAEGGIMRANYAGGSSPNERFEMKVKELIRDMGISRELAEALVLGSDPGSIEFLKSIPDPNKDLKAEGGRIGYARGTDLEAGAQPITIEGDIRPNNMMMASESPEEELEMLRDIELLQEMKEFEEFRKNNPGSTYDDFKSSKLARKEISDLDLILKIMETEGDDFGSATKKMEMYRRMEENKNNRPKDPAKGVRKIKLAQGGLSSLLGE